MHREFVMPARIQMTGQRDPPGGASNIRILRRLLRQPAAPALLGKPIKKPPHNVRMMGVALMNEQNGSRFQAAGEALQNERDPAGAGVESPVPPAPSLKAAFPQNGRVEGIAEAGGGAEEAGRAAGEA